MCWLLLCVISPLSRQRYIIIPGRVHADSLQESTSHIWQHNIHAHMCTQHLGRDQRQVRMLHVKKENKKKKKEEKEKKRNMEYLWTDVDGNRRRLQIPEGMTKWFGLTESQTGRTCRKCSLVTRPEIAAHTASTPRQCHAFSMLSLKPWGLGAVEEGNILQPPKEKKETITITRRWNS